MLPYALVLFVTSIFFAAGMETPLFTFSTRTPVSVLNRDRTVSSGKTTRSTVTPTDTYTLRGWCTPNRQKYNESRDMIDLTCHTGKNAISEDRLQFFGIPSRIWATKEEAEVYAIPFC